MTVDDKAWLIETVRGMKVEDAVHLLYPRVIPVSQLEVFTFIIILLAVANFQIADPSEIPTLPPQTRASIEFMENDKVWDSLGSLLINFRLM